MINKNSSSIKLEKYVSILLLAFILLNNDPENII